MVSGKLDGNKTSMMLDLGADVSVFPLSCRAGQKTVYHTTI